MKNKIIFLIIGILIGAILATGGWFIYSKCTSSNSNMPGNGMEQNGGAPNMQNGDMGNPPEKPDGDNSTTPPTKPDSNSTNSTENTNT